MRQKKARLVLAYLRRALINARLGHPLTVRTILDNRTSLYQPLSETSLSGALTRPLMPVSRVARRLSEHRAAGLTEDRAARLGNITESAATLDETVRRVAGRRFRYDMLKTVSGILPKHRVSACQKVPSFAVQNGDSSRGISRNENGHASFHGVGSCGDVWNCPVCAARIASGRKDEIRHAMSENRKAGGSALLVTWTFPHTRDDNLKDILARFLEAMRKCKSWRGYKKARETVGYHGQIRALEVTHGNDNGWHPHCHEVWFLEGKITPQAALQLEKSLYQEWAKACLKVGLPLPSSQYGIDVRFRESDSEDDDAAGSYIAKWGSELTHAHMKTGKKGSRSPWAILASLTKEFKLSDAKLFREYSEAFKGRAQLFWSRGLKDRFQVEEVSDEMMADRPEKEVIRELDSVEWSAIVKTRAHCQVLEVAEFQPEKLDSFILSLVDRVNDYFRSKSRMRRTIEEYTVRHMRVLEHPLPDHPFSEAC